MTKGAALGSLTVMLFCTVGVAGSQPAPLQGLQVSATATLESRSGIYTYKYLVVHSRSSATEVNGVVIDITRGGGEALLSAAGLVNGPRYMRHGSEDSLQRVSMVPVGMSAPEGWTSELGYEIGPPQRGVASWGSIDEPFRIRPGQARGGFQLTSPALPGIREVAIEPAVDPPSNLNDWASLDAFYRQVAFRASTVAPKAPPASFVPIEFLNYLITLVHDSQLLGWIRESEDHQKLLRRLIDAKRRLEEQKPAKAAKRIEQFLKTVEQDACREFTCRKPAALTSEAYALLFFNGRYLLERLPPPAGDDDLGNS